MQCERARSRRARAAIDRWMAFPPSHTHIHHTLSDNFVDALDGRAVGDMSVRELYGGARISFICHEIFAKSLLAMDPFEGDFNGSVHRN